MRIAVVKETVAHENRVALDPESVGKLVKAGFTVDVESGAGREAEFSDEEYRDAGASVGRLLLSSADVVLSVQQLTRQQIHSVRHGALIVSFFDEGDNSELYALLNKTQVSAFALNRVPRISRAQKLDAVTSQSLIAGYRGAVIAAGMFKRFFATHVTAAGTIPPAKVLVLGAGVAGLEAMGTAVRMGAVVSGWDTRQSAAEEIPSVGARFVTEPLSEAVTDADVVIATVGLTGGDVPTLVTVDMMRSMRPGSVVIDIVADRGGNVEGVTPGRIHTIGRTQVWGGHNVAAQLAGPASYLLAHNMLAVLDVLVDEDRNFAWDMNDEIIASALVTHQGQTRKTREPEVE